MYIELYIPWLIIRIFWDTIAYLGFEYKYMVQYYYI